MRRNIMQISIHASGFCAVAARIGTGTDQADRLRQAGARAVACVDDVAKDER
jgi:hypothetical protein